MRLFSTLSCCLWSEERFECDGEFVGCVGCKHEELRMCRVRKRRECE